MTVASVDMVTVLVVEDDPLLRALIQEELIDCGYEAIGLRDAEAARTLLQSATDIAVLVTDVNLPGAMDGADLAHWAKQHKPELLTVVMSGRHDSKAKVESLCEAARFFPKPFLVEDLIEHIRSSRPFPA